MKQDSFVQKILNAVYSYLIFFVISAALVSCSTMIFVSTMANSMNIELTDENISISAKLTFLIILFFSGIFAIIDTIRRKLTVERTARHIVEASKKIIDGDFTARIRPLSRFTVDENFNHIIECFNVMAEELSGV